MDREAARLVTPDWAPAHLAVPIVRAGNTVTVVVSDLPSQAVLDDLSARTRYRIELALASAPRIRELIHAAGANVHRPAPQASPDRIGC